MIRTEDFGEIGFGGALTLATWWDDKRIGEGKIATKDVLKKASFYTYWGVGLASTLVSAFGWMPKWQRWAEHISHGFLYDLPRNTYNLSQALGTQGGRGSSSAAVKEAQRLVRERQKTKQLVDAQTGRSYQSEFRKVVMY